MRSKLLALLMAGLLVAALAPAGAQARGPRPIKRPTSPGRDGRRGTAFVPREVLVRFTGTATRADKRATHEAVGARVQEKLLLRDTYRVRLPAGLSVREGVRRYLQNGDVHAATPNYLRYRSDMTPDDARLWGLNNTMQTVRRIQGTTDADIDAPEAWVTETGDPNTVVAVIDDGVNINHPDLNDNIFVNAGDPINGVDNDGNGLKDDRNGWDFANNDAGVIGPDGHGTHVAGTIGAEDNGSGVTGVTQDVSLLPIKIFPDVGDATSAAAINAYIYAALMGADVANGSFGGPGGSFLEMEALMAARGTLFVFAAGNGVDYNNPNTGDDNDSFPIFPCNYQVPNVICVAATDQNDILTSFSNFGDSTVHIAAPGHNILSTSRFQMAVDETFEDLVAPALPSGWSSAGTANTWGTYNDTTNGTNWLVSNTGPAYSANANSYTRTPALNLSGNSSCSLDLILYRQLGSGDSLSIELSVNNGADNFPNLLGGVPFVGDNISTSGNPVVSLGISNALFTTQNALRFRLVSDASDQGQGVYIDDVQLRCRKTDGSNATYEFLQGTSMAAPHVTGAAALLYSNQPGANPFSARRALMASADPKASLAGKLKPGSGRLNADALLDEDATPQFGPPTLGGAALSKTFQKKAVIPMTITTAGASGFRLWKQSTRFNQGFGDQTFPAVGGSPKVAAKAGFTHCFAASARDAQGNESNFSGRKCTAVPVNNVTLKHSKGWSKKKVRGSFLNTVSQSSKKGSSVSLAGVIFDKLALVATKCKGCGTVGLFFGKQKKPFKKVSLNAPKTKKLQIISLFGKSGGPFKSKITLKVLSSGKPVKIEGLGVFVRPFFS